MKEAEIIKNLEGVQAKAACALKEMSVEERQKYAPHLLKGEDKNIKVVLFFIYNLWNEDNIKRLVAADDFFQIECYLGWIKHSLMRKTGVYGYQTCLSEFKQELFKAGKARLLILLEQYFSLSAEDEIQLISIRREKNTEKAVDAFLLWYWQTRRLKQKTIQFLQTPDNQDLWQKYQETSAFARYEKLFS